LKLSVFYDHAVQAARQSGQPIEKVLAAFKRAGIDAVEMDYETARGQILSIGGLLGEAGLEISGFYYNHNFNWNPSIESSKEMVDLASTLDVHRILMVPGFLDEEDVPALNGVHNDYQKTAAYMDGDSEIQNMKQALTDLSAYARKRGVILSLEDYDLITSPYSQINELLWFIGKVPGLGITFDTGNFAFSKEDSLLAFEALKDHIVHVHLKDRAHLVGGSPADNRTFLAPAPVGDGYLPVGLLIRRLKQIGYDGYLVIEHFDLKDELDSVLRSAAYVKNVLSFT